jgi:Ca-activated chloride channel homolog
MKAGILFVLATHSALVLAQEHPPLFAGRAAELVVLPVTVTDRRGAFVADLARDRFTVYDNGRPQDLVLFSGEDMPVSVGLVLDTSSSMRPKIPDVISSALSFARLSNPSDELFTIPFNDVVLDQTSGRAPVSDTQSLEIALHSLVPQGRTALYDALLAGLDRVTRGSHPRKALIVVSDGGDNASRATLESVMAQARRANVTIFTIGLYDEADFERNPGVLKSLAASTGGERFLPRSSKLLAAACERIARELRAGYTLGYVPPDSDGAYHRVRVEVQQGKGPRLTVRTRPGYFAAAHP